MTWCRMTCLLFIITKPIAVLLFKITAISIITNLEDIFYQIFQRQVVAMLDGSKCHTQRGICDWSLVT